MGTTQRRCICWNCDTQFDVEVEDVEETIVRVVMGTESKQQKKVGRKYIIKCPKCSKENEVRL
jgi:hypothetical protein